MKSNIIRNIKADFVKVSCTFDHEEKSGVYTVFGTASYDRLTGEFSLKWSHNCPLSLAQRLGQLMWFVKFLISL